MVTNADQLLADKVIKELGDLKFSVLQLESYLTVANERIKQLEQAQTSVQDGKQPLVD